MKCLWFLCVLLDYRFKFIKRYEIAVLIKIMVKKYNLVVANEMYSNYLN